MQYKKKLFLLCWGLLLTMITLAQVGINIDGSTPDSSAILDVKSISKALLIPRMTILQLNSIASPANGLIAYCIDCNNSHGSLAVYFSGKWNFFSSDVVNRVPQVLNPNQSGSASKGSVLSGNYLYFDSERDPEGTSQYYWYRADDAVGSNEIEIATSRIYTITQNDVNKFLRFGVTPIAISGSNPGFLTKSAQFTGQVSNNTAPSAISVMFSGIPATGQLFSGSYEYSDAENDPEQNSTFQWYSAIDSSGSGETAISGATGKEYTTTSLDISRCVRFGVTPKSSRGVSPGAEVKSPFSAAISSNQPPTCTGLTISGSSAQGNLLTGSCTYYDPEGDPMDHLLFQWYRADNSDGLNETPIPGANVNDGMTKTFYTTGILDVGKVLRFGAASFALTGSNPGQEVHSSYTPSVSQNQPPFALNVYQSGGTHSGMWVNGGVSYYDQEGDLEGQSIRLWYMADDTLGTNEMYLNLNSWTIKLENFEIGRYIRYGITPVAVSGTSPGAHVKSLRYLGPVTPNLPPVATDVTQTMTNPWVGLWLNASFSYSDPEWDNQGSNIYEWYRADNDMGLNETQITAAFGPSYMITMADTNKYLRCGVVPVAITGTTPGTLVKATSFIGPVTMGISTCDAFTYSTVSAGGHIWMDRNLGASRVATSWNDFEAAGSLFQWGRSADGHQCMNRSSSSAIYPEHDTTSVKCGSGSCPNALFVVSNSDPNDWLTTSDTTLWYGVVKGQNDPCPTGFRVPTFGELQDLWNSFSPQNYLGAFSSPAKLPVTGSRSSSPGNIYVTGGFYWSSSTAETGSGCGYFTTFSAIVETPWPRAQGLAVRCIQE